MQTYIAHYRSPSASAQRAKGVFEFESDARAGTKANGHDARMRMLELFGKDAVSWTIDKVDFRAPKPVRKRAKKKEYW